jgi:hypothetical protein
MRRPREQQKLQDDARLLRAWRHWHREQLKAVLAGPHSGVLAELFRMIAHLAHVQPAQLLGLAQTIDWSPIDPATRQVVLHELNVAIMALRVKHGLDPLDDGLPDEPDTPFRRLKQLLD